MNVLVLSQYFLPQPLANAETIGAIVSGLGARGHELHVVTPARGDVDLPGVTVHRALGYFAPDRASKVKRALEYLSFSAGALLAALRAPRPDVVLVPSPPPTLGLVGLIVAGLRRAPLVYNVQDLYPEVAIAAGAVKPGPLLRLLARAMRLVYRRSGAVVVIDPVFVDAINWVEAAARVRAVRNGIDLGPFEGAARDPRYLAEVGVPDGAKVVMYAGNVGRSQDLDAVIEATGATGCHLVIHGGGATLEDVKADVRRRQLDHVHFSSFRPREELGTVFASADLHMVPLKPDIASSSVPSKLLSIFAAGRPAVVAAEPDSATAQVLLESGGGWLVPPGDATAMAAAITTAFADDAGRIERGRRGRDWVAAHGSRERCAADYEAVLAEVIARDTP
jgi:putative colanic acid biosynthesis glycosyltransferase WcaI